MKVADIWKKSTEYFPVEKLKCRDLLPVYEKFREVGYTEKNALDRLKTGYLAYAKLRDFPKYLAAGLKDDTDIDRLVKLFLLNLKIPAYHARKTFGSNVLNIMLDTGMITRIDNTEIKSAVDIFPCGDCFIVTDQCFTDVCVPKHVYPLMSDSYYLARSMITEPVEKSLDLCTGSGVQAITASRFSKKVIGVDINPRAINFARFNALLNQADNVEFRKGNLYDVLKGEKFDRIYSNPPFVPSPEKRVYFRDGGRSGEDVLEKIVAGLETHLNDSGICQIVTLLVFTGGDYNKKVATWVPGRKFHIFSIHSSNVDIEDYIILHLGGIQGLSFQQYSEKVNAWINSYRDAGIERVAQGLINLKHTDAEPESDIKMMKDIIPDGCGKRIKAWLDTVTAREGNHLADTLMDNTLVISGDVESITERKIIGGGIEHEVVFHKTSPSLPTLITLEEKILLDSIDEKPVKVKDLLDIYSRRNPGSHEKFIDVIMALLKEGILENQKSDF
jgi:methylase of polypeptide subunit release factors